MWPIDKFFVPCELNPIVLAINRKPPLHSIQPKADIFQVVVPIYSNAIRHGHQPWNRVLFEILIPDHELLNDVDAQHVLLCIVRFTVLDIETLGQILIIESLSDVFIVSLNEGIVGLFREVTLQEVQ